jgi:DNA-binding transcriptional LysR family regulator
MNLQQLRFASAVFDTLSFSKAAELCFVTQSTLSSGIAELEQELGQKLFERNTRTVSATDFGLAMQPRIHSVLAAQEDLLLQAQGFAQAHAGCLRIGLSPLISRAALRAPLNRFRELRPGIEVTLSEMNLTDLQDALEQQRIDFMLAPTRKCRPGERAASLYSELLVFVPQAGRDPVPASDGAVRLKTLAAETFIMVPDECGLAIETRGLFARHRLAPREYSGKALSYEVLEDWAEMGVGAALIPEAKLSLSQNHSLRVICSDGQPAKINYSAIWKTSAEARAEIAVFARLMAQSGET